MVKKGLFIQVPRDDISRKTEAYFIQREMAKSFKCKANHAMQQKGQNKVTVLGLSLSKNFIEFEVLDAFQIGKR